MTKHKRAIGLAVLLVLLPGMAGCPALERDAYNTVVGAKAFIDAEKKIHPECVNLAASNLCMNLGKATSAKDALIDAAEVYCSGPQFEAGGPCQPPAKGTAAYTQAEAKLKAAIAAYKQVEKDVKGAI